MNRALYPVLLLLVVAPSARAADDGSAPSCVPQASVRENPGFRNDTWLSRERGDDARMHLSKVMDSKDWRGNELYRACEQMKTPCMIARLEDGTGPGTQVGVGRQKDLFQELARASGHSRQEADVLAGRYATLAGAYFRQVPKEGGGWESEETAILRKHRRQLGFQDSGSRQVQPAGDDQSAKAKVTDLKARIKDAKKRGDMAEVMRLAAEAQQTAPGAKAAEQTAAIDRDTKQQAWLLAESSFSELSTAAYRSRILVSTMCICAGRCRLPIGEGADKNW